MRGRASTKVIHRFCSRFVTLASVRYLRLYRAFAGNNLSRALEFRAQFVAGIVAYMIWNGASLLFIDVVFRQVGAVRGWSREEMWVLLGTFVILESLCYGLLGPNMWRFAGAVRDGSLDLNLTKPANTQFLVSTRYMDFNGLLNSVVGVALIAFGLGRLGRAPAWHEWVLWLVLLACGFVMAYAFWFWMVTWSVWAVKLDSIAVAFDPVMQLARFPVQIYPQSVQLLFVTILPIAFLTTYPAGALLGHPVARVLPLALALSGVALWCSHRFFQFALRHYGSASS